jgi:hypothetical protein
MDDFFLIFFLNVFHAASTSAMRFCFRFMVYDVHYMPSTEEKHEQ